MLKPAPRAGKGLYRSAHSKGIVDTAGDPDEAYEISKGLCGESGRRGSRTVQLQFEILNQSILLWETDNLGYSEPAGWVNMQAVLMDMGLLIRDPRIWSKAFTNDLLP